MLRDGLWVFCFVSGDVGYCTRLARWWSISCCFSTMSRLVTLEPFWKRRYYDAHTICHERVGYAVMLILRNGFRIQGIEQDNSVEYHPDPPPDTYEYPEAKRDKRETAFIPRKLECVYQFLPCLRYGIACFIRGAMHYSCCRSICCVPTNPTRAQV